MRYRLRFYTSVVLAPAILIAGLSVWRAGGQSRAEQTPAVAPPQAATAPAKPADPKPQLTDSSQQRRLLDELFGRLSKSTDSEESQGIAGAIERVWMRSGSDTADLLMGRALSAVQAKQLPLAEKLLSSVIAVEPEWAEAWNKRATIRFMSDDDSGAMQDIAQVLRREPRHFGALVGMGSILQRSGLNKAALKVYRKALEVYPQQANIRTIVDKLTLEVEGRDI